MTESSPPHPDEPVELVINSAGMAALAACEVFQCDFCRRSLASGDGFHRVTLGMDELPCHVGGAIDRDSTVEETSELVACTACEPAVSEAFESLLTQLWALRRPDPVTEDDEPTLRAVETQGTNSP